MLKAILLRLSRSSTPFLGDQSIAAPATADASAPDVQTFVSAFECVFLDYSGHVNFAAGLSGSKAKLVRNAHACGTLPCLPSALWHGHCQYSDLVFHGQRMQVLVYLPPMHSLE